MSTAPHNSLALALDGMSSPVRFFVRDDDAGWADERLLALLAVMADVGVPVDLAAIPDAVTPALARELLLRQRGQALGIHQHGCRHTNHEFAERKCEFGAARSVHQQQADLVHGRKVLQALFPVGLDPLFTPPWNRVGADTPAILAALGFTALSRDITAPAQLALPEISVHTDWSKLWRLAQGQVAAESLALDLARHVREGACIGLMLHHAEMSDAELEALRALLTTFGRHPMARWILMHQVMEDMPMPEPDRRTGRTLAHSNEASV